MSPPHQSPYPSSLVKLPASMVVAASIHKIDTLQLIPPILWKHPLPSWARWPAKGNDIFADCCEILMVSYGNEGSSNVTGRSSCHDAITLLENERSIYDTCVRDIFHRYETRYTRSVEFLHIFAAYTGWTPVSRAYQHSSRPNWT